MHAAGHQVVPGALGGGFAEHGRLHLVEAVTVEVGLGGILHLMAELQRLLHGWAAQIQVAVLQPQLLAHLRVLVHGVGQGLGLGQHRQGRGRQLHLAGEEPGVVGAFVPQADLALHLHHALQVHALRLVEVLLRQQPQVAHHLGHALPVLHVQEDHAAHVALDLHPAAQHGPLAHMLPTDVSAIMCPLHTFTSSFSDGPEIKKAVLLPHASWGERRSSYAVPPTFASIRTRGRSLSRQRPLRRLPEAVTGFPRPRLLGDEPLGRRLRAVPSPGCPAALAP